MIWVHLNQSSTNLSTTFMGDEMYVNHLNKINIETKN